MYRQIKINPEQTFLHNILWRDSPNEPFQCLELQTVTYGTNFAPYVATRTLNDIAINDKKHPLAANALLSQTYVDDILSGCDSYEELEELYKQLNSLLNKFGFNLHKWCSNSKEFLNKINHPIAVDSDINFNKAISTVLGLKWDSLTDNFLISAPNSFDEVVITKRKILSSLAQCFDPTGLVNPVIVQGKALMQKLWIKKLSWDEEITDPSLIKHWNEFVSNILLIKNLVIPRCIFSNTNINKIEIHGFADASTMAYGACIYHSQ
jgi:Pao retrotransposon peptidase